MKNFTTKDWNKISDADYIVGLKNGDTCITKAFFYGLCNYMLNDIRVSLMNKAVGYDELVNELYSHLSAKQWHKLDTFKGVDGCCLRTWTIKVTWRFFCKRRTYLLGSCNINTDDIQIADLEDRTDLSLSMEVESAFKAMGNERYVKVLKWMLIEGYDAKEVATFLNTSTNNVYNLKHRAIVRFTEVFNV